MKAEKKTFYTELAYIVGLVLLALGASLMEKADFGVSMIVAPAYLLYLKISEIWPFFTFGMAEYLMQFVLLLLMFLVLRRVRLSYFFSFITALAYGIILDSFMLLCGCMGELSLGGRSACYIIGMVFSSLGVAFIFHTYIAPEVYELFVKEVSAKWNLPLTKCKTVYDCISCVFAVALSFLFFGFGHFEGVKWGTIVCALLNGAMIGVMSSVIEKLWDFKDGMKFRKFFS